MRQLFSVVLCCVLFLGSVQCVFAGAFKLEMGMTKQQVKNALGVYLEEYEGGFGYKYYLRQRVRGKSSDYKVTSVTIHPLVGLVEFNVWKTVIPSTAKNVREVYTRAKNTISEKYDKKGKDMEGRSAILDRLLAIGTRDTLDKADNLNETDEQFMQRLKADTIFKTEWKFDENENEEFQRITLILYSGRLSNKEVKMLISYYGYFSAEVSGEIEALKEQQKEAERKAEYDQF